MEYAYSRRGIPILPLPVKLEALSSCMETGSFEDAAGHLCDLLALCQSKLKTNNLPRFNDLQHMVSYYGRDPTPIEPDNFHLYYLGLETLDTPK